MTKRFAGDKGDQHAMPGVLIATAYAITIEFDGGEYRVLLDDELLSSHPTLYRAQYAALQAAREINPKTRTVEFSTDELGNQVALVESEE